MIAYGAGLRPGELLKLRVQDIDSKSMQIFVCQEKGGVDYCTLLSELNLEVLREYANIGNNTTSL